MEGLGSERGAETIDLNNDKTQFGYRPFGRAADNVLQTVWFEGTDRRNRESDTFFSGPDSMARRTCLAPSRSCGGRVHAVLRRRKRYGGRSSKAYASCNLASDARASPPLMSGTMLNSSAVTLSRFTV